MSAPAVISIIGTKFSRIFWQFFGTLSIAGLLLGFLCFYLSLMPMLLPRSWLVQALCSGVSATIGYAVGKLMGSGVRGICWLCRLPAPSLGERLRVRLILSTIGLMVLVAVVLYQHSIMEAMRRLMSMTSEPITLTALGVFLGLLLWGVLVVISRWLVLLIAKLVNLIAPRMHLPIRALCWVVVSLVVGTLLLEMTRHYLWQPTFQRISKQAEQLNLTEPVALFAPQSPYRSGVNGISAQPWQALGHYGQRFVALGLDADDISALTGRPASEPIRLFVGLNNQDLDDATAQSLVATAMSELERTGAWSRAHLVIYGATGRGWVEEYSSLAAEYLTDGDIASIAVQYSYLPSQVSFLVDRQASSLVNQLLYRAIRDKLDSLPINSRPKLYLAGESLGAFATQSNFESYQALISGLDGAVWVGTPRLSPLWEHLVARRMTGSTETLPIIDGGRHVRFMDYPETLGGGHPQNQLYGEWQAPRVVFVQYASDPIVWLSDDMLLRRPDWMAEPAGRDIARVPTWLPIISLWEMVLDMPASSNTPAGHGHIYRYDTIHAWQAVLDKPTPSAADIAHAIDERIGKLVVERKD